MRTFLVFTLFDLITTSSTIHNIRQEKNVKSLISTVGKKQVLTTKSKRSKM